MATAVKPLPGLNQLGCGYNVLTGEYASSTSCKTKCMFNLGEYEDETKEVGAREYKCPEKVNFQELDMSELQRQTGNSAEEFTSALSQSMKISGSYGCFSGSISQNFDSNTIRSNQYSFARVQSNIKKYKLALPIKSQLHDLLKEDYKKMIDLDTTTPETLFSEVGTHVLTSVLVGGRVVYTSATNRFNYASSFSLGVVAEASYNAFVSIKAVVGVSYKEDVKKFNENSEIKVTTRGGDASLGSKLAENYQKWAESVSDKPVMVDFGDADSLVPIWELVDPNLPARKKALEDAYPAFCEKNRTKFKNKQPVLHAKRVRLTTITGNDSGLSTRSKVTFARPDVGDDWFYLGPVAYEGSREPDGYTYVFKEIQKGSVLADIASWEKVWNDAGSGVHPTSYSIHRGLAANPVDYKVVGDVFLKGGDSNDCSPSQDAYKSVVTGMKAIHVDCLKQAKIGARIWTDAGSGANGSGSVWKIIAIDNAKSWIPHTVVASAESGYKEPKRDVYTIDAAMVIMDQTFNYIEVTAEDNE